MSNYHEFSSEAVEGAIAAAKAHNDDVGFDRADQNINLVGGGDFLVTAECISVVVEGHKICVRLPLGIGQVCLPIPISIPNGTAAEACLAICTTWGFPTGVRVTVSALGHVIVQKTFGKC